MKELPEGLRQGRVAARWIYYGGGVVSGVEWQLSLSENPAGRQWL